MTKARDELVNEFGYTHGVTGKSSEEPSGPAYELIERFGYDEEQLVYLDDEQIGNLLCLERLEAEGSALGESIWQLQNEANSDPTAEHYARVNSARLEAIQAQIEEMSDVSLLRDMLYSEIASYDTSPSPC